MINEYYVFCFILFYFVLFCFILFYFILFYFILQINTRGGPSLSTQPQTNLAHLFFSSGAQPHNQAGPSLRKIFRHIVTQLCQLLPTPAKLSRTCQIPTCA